MKTIITITAEHNDEWPEDAIKLVLKDALNEFINERSAGGVLGYVRDRYEGETESAQARKVVEVCRRISIAKRLKAGVDDAGFIQVALPEEASNVKSCTGVSCDGGCDSD